MVIDPGTRERAALEAARLMLKLVSRHFSESGSALHDDGNCPRCADEDRAEDAILAYGRAVREADVAELNRRIIEMREGLIWKRGLPEYLMECAAAIEALEGKP